MIEAPALSDQVGAELRPDQSEEEERPCLWPLKLLGESVLDSLDRKYQARQRGERLGLALDGFPSLAKELGGTFMTGLHILHGNTGSGKSAFALQLAHTCQCPALYVTCEMNADVLMWRLMARCARIPLSHFPDGQISREKATEALALVLAKGSDLAILDASRASVPIQLIEEMALITRGNTPHFGIFVDSVHSWSEGSYPDLAEYEALARGIRDLNRLAIRLDCPIMGLAERNRMNMKTGGVNASAGSRKFEYTAETVLDLTPEGGDETTDEVRMKLSFAKNRWGAGGRAVSLLFNGQYQWFREE